MILKIQYPQEAGKMALILGDIELIVKLSPFKINCMNKAKKSSKLPNEPKLFCHFQPKSEIKFRYWYSNLC